MQRRTFLKLGTLAVYANANTLKNNDKILTKDEFVLLKSINKKIKSVRSHVGFGNFNLIDFDQMLKVAKYLKKEDKFSKLDIAFMEEFFYKDASEFSFYGKRTCNKIDEKISKKDVVKIPKTGHYLFVDKSLEDYERILKDVGNTLFLTSGVRSVVKQMSLFFDKIITCDANITKASHSIAPIGYSYHSLGDFDVGKIGWGAKNFTASFARTKEFWALTKLPYISMRYTINNLDGVRFEPWHIKII